MFKENQIVKVNLDKVNQDSYYNDRFKFSDNEYFFYRYHSFDPAIVYVKGYEGYCKESYPVKLKHIMLVDDGIKCRKNCG